jgi:hypothetical protein
MKAFFVGGVTDNSELDLEGAPPPHYPDAKGSGVHRYRLHSTGGETDHGSPQYAVYAPPEMDDAEVARVVAERRYAQRFAQGTRPG